MLPITTLFLNFLKIFFMLFRLCIIMILHISIFFIFVMIINYIHWFIALCHCFFVLVTINVYKKDQ